MKKIVSLLIAMMLITCACTQTPSPQRKNLPGDNKQIAPETKESSIFDRGVIEKVRVVNDNSHVRAGFSQNYPVVATLNKGDIVDVVGEFNDWYTVQLDNNYVGAVSAADVTPVVVEEMQPNLPEDRPDRNERPLEPPVEGDTEGNIEGEPDIDDEPNIDEAPKGIIPGPDTNVPERDLNRDDNTNEPNRDLDAGRDKNDDTTPAPTGNLAAMEEQMLTLINSERAKNNLSPLIMDSQVRQVARIKAQDMVDNDYFSHYSPTYGSPFDMLDEFGIKYIAAGENLAGNSTVQKAHDALMNSAGHRKNILHSQFTHIGIGIKKSDRYGYIFTQMFLSKPK